MSSKDISVESIIQFAHPVQEVSEGNTGLEVFLVIFWQKMYPPSDLVLRMESKMKRN